MQTPITARHCEISDALRERALTVVERLGTIATPAMEASPVFATDGQQQTAELRLHLATGDLLVAGGEAGDHRSALDRAKDKLRKQMEKASARPRPSRPSGVNPL